jgi:periplasmic divalent cation tolerance protein
MESETLLVLTTCGNDGDAAALARLLVERRLAACVNAVSNVASTYRWEGKIVADREALLIIKTTKALLPALEAVIRAESTYEVPEILAVPVAGGSPPYLAWLAESVAPEQDSAV